MFNIVVCCNVRITTYKDNDRSHKAGVASMAYGVNMADGCIDSVSGRSICNE
jgi:hypothetical protein